MSAETEALWLFERATKEDRQAWLDKLGELFGFPNRPYTPEEYLEAFSSCHFPVDG